MATQLKGIRGLWLWAGLLGLVLVLAILPLSLRAQVLWALAVLSLVALGWLFSGRAASRQRQSLMLAGNCALPADGYHQPVLAVCGDGLHSLFGATPEDQLVLRVTEQGCYLRVPSLDQLPTIIEYVLANRPHWAGQLGVLDSQRLIVKPDEGAQLNAPLSADAQYVAVVALFRSPDTQSDSWRLVLSREDLDPDQPRVVELGDNALNLVPLPKKDSWW